MFGAASVGKVYASPIAPKTAFVYFVDSCWEEREKTCSNANYELVFDECLDRWPTMSDEEKKSFNEMAVNDEKRYDDEMKKYNPPPEEEKQPGKKQRGKKQKRDEYLIAPERPMPADSWFEKEERAIVETQNPNFGFCEVSQEVLKRWAARTPETRAKYEALAAKDKVRYAKEKAAYQKKLYEKLQLLSVAESDDSDD